MVFDWSKKSSLTWAKYKRRNLETFAKSIGEQGVFYKRG